MLASWVKQGTTTTGTGTVTLDGTPDSGFIGFSDAFDSGVSVPYLITDGNNRESGYGTLTTGANWTLTRTQIYEKLDAGVYTQNPATGLTLSGSAVVTVGSTAAQSGVGGRYVVTGTTASFLGDARGTTLGAQNAALPAVDTVYYEPLTLYTPRLVGSLTLYVAAADATAFVKAGIYTAKVDNYPGNLIQSVTFDVSTTGAKNVALASDVLLMPGVYWIGIATDDVTTATFRCPNFRNYVGGEEIGRNSAATGYAKYVATEAISNGFTDLPATANGTASIVTEIPYMGLGA